MNAEKVFLQPFLTKIEEDIKLSYLKDLDKTIQMQQLSTIINQMIDDESLEKYFKDIPSELEYFQQKFTREVLFYILKQNIIYGTNGDEIALKLLLDYTSLWKKYHKSSQYAFLWENMREIFDPSKLFFTIPCNYSCKMNPIKNYSAAKFNEELPKNTEFYKEYNIGDYVDFCFETHSRISYDKKQWIQAKISNVDENYYTLDTTTNPRVIRKNDMSILPVGTVTKDWAWRSNLKQWDTIDCYDRGRWYPATILSVTKQQSGGVDQISYHIGFRLYPKFFPSYEKYLKYWSCVSHDYDKQHEEFYGDKENMDETISFSSRRIQQLNSMITKENKQSTNYPFQEESDDTSFYMDSLYKFIGDDGKKNYIIGHNSNNFSYYFARFLQEFANDEGFEKMIKILLNKPTAEEVYMIFFILHKSFPYLHRDFINEISEQITQGAIDFIQSIDNNEMRNLKKDIMELMTKVITLSSSSLTSNNKENKECLIQQLTQIITLKFIKTSIFDKKLQGVKSLSDYIKINRSDNEKMESIINMIIENNIIEEIFGSNSHSQIISKASEIVEIMIIKDQLTETHIDLIWTGTLKGDLEGKLTILNLLTEVSHYLNKTHIKILLTKIYSHIDNDMSSNEMDLIYNLSITYNDESNIQHCLIFFYDCLMAIKTKDESRLVKLIEKIYYIVTLYPNLIYLIIDSCLKKIKNFENSLLNMKLLLKLIIEDNSFTKISSRLEDDEGLVKIFIENCYMYKSKIKEEMSKCKDKDNLKLITIESYNHDVNVSTRMSFLQIIKKYLFISSKISLLDFLYHFLLEDCISSNDQDEFYDYIKELSIEELQLKETIEEIFNLFKEKICKTLTQCAQLSSKAFEYFINFFLEYNSNKAFIKYYTVNYKLAIVSLSKEPQELEGFDILWNIIFESNDDEVMNKGIETLQILFSNEKENNKSNYLQSKCLELIKAESLNSTEANVNKIKKCLKILNILIEESEKEGTGKIKSHSALRKRYVIELIILVVNTLGGHEVFTLKLLSNTTIYEVKEIIGTKCKSELDIMKVLCSLKEITALGKTLYDLNVKEKNDIRVNIFSKSAILINADGTLNPLFNNILNEWFDTFSTENKMTRETCAEFITAVVTVKEKITTENHRVNIIFDNCDKDKKGYVAREDFIHFYAESARIKTKTVWDNLHTMGVKNNLKKKDEEMIFTQIPIETLPRYQLANDEDFINFLFTLSNKTEIQRDLNDFLFTLSTNKAIYDQIYSDTDGSYMKSLFKENNIHKIIYAFHIIQSILEDIEIDWENINSFKYKGFDKDDYDIDSREKLEWIKKFINNDYVNMIEYFSSCILTKDLNEDINKIAFDAVIGIISFFFKSTLNKNPYYKEAFTSLPSFNNNDCESTKKNQNDQNTNGYSLLNEEELEHRNNNEDNNKSLFKNSNKQTHIKPISYNLILNELHMNELGDIILKSINNQNLIDQLIKLIYDLLSNINHLGLSLSLVNKQIIEKCFELLLGVLVFVVDHNSFLQIISTSEKQLLSIIHNGIISSTACNIHKSLCETLVKYFKVAEKIPNWNFLFLIFKIFMSLFNNLQINTNTNTNSDQHDFTLFFDSFSLLFEIIIKIPSLELKEHLTENNIDLEQLILNITKIIYDDLSISPSPIPTEETKQELSDYLLIGYIKILTKAIDNSPQIKENISTQFNLSKILLEKIIFNQSNDIKQKESEDKFISIDSSIASLKTSRSKNKQIREVCYHLIFSLTKNTLDCLDICYFITKSNEKEEEDEKVEKNNQQKTYNVHNKYNMHFNQSKREGHVGLKNLGCICYMNSILQQMFMVPTFRYAILQSDDKKEIPNTSTVFDDNTLHQLQKMYTYLTLSSREDFNPKLFCNSFKDFDGMPINPIIQQDSQEFYNAFCDKIENCLKETALKYIINDVFVGRTCSQVICEACGNVSNRFEDFYNLSLEVANMTTLKDSLNNMIAPEIIDNFNCETCQKKVRITKRTSISNLPNVFIIHLKRFFMNYEIEHTEKIDSKLEFPTEINLKQFCIEDLMHNKSPGYETDDIYYKKDEYYEYNLVGVNIHFGSADRGHYFSLINTIRSGKDNQAEYDPKNKANTRSWLKFNDSTISKFDIDQLNDECFGGSSSESSRYHMYENSQSAYLLIYERKQKTPIRLIVEEPQNKDESLISFKEDDKTRIIKENDISNQKASNDLLDSLWNKVFYDSKKNEYYQYHPFFSIDKKAPRQYYQEVINDNVQFDKQQSNETNEFNNIYNTVFNKLISSLKNSIGSYDEETKIKLCHIFMYYLLKISLKKNKYDLTSYSTASMENESPQGINNVDISDIISKLNLFIVQSKRCVLLCIDHFSKDNNIVNIFQNESLANMTQYSAFLRNLIRLGIAYDKETELENLWILIHKLLSLLKQAHNSSEIHPPLHDLIESFLEHESILEKKLFKSTYISDIILYAQSLIDSRSAVLFNPISNQNEKNNAKQIISILHKIFLRTIEFNTNEYIDSKNKPKKHLSLYSIQNHLTLFKNQYLLKYIYDCNLQFFIDIMIVLQSDSGDYSSEICIELCDFIHDTFKQASSSQSDKEKLFDTILIILSIQDHYQLNRMMILVGHPNLIFEEGGNRSRWPLFGYNVMKNKTSPYLRYITVNHAKGTSCLLGKLTTLPPIAHITIALLYKLINSAVENMNLFKYIFLMPCDNLEHKNFIDKAKGMFNDYLKNSDHDESMELKVKELYEKIENMEVKYIDVQNMIEKNRIAIEDDNDDDDYENQSPMKLFQGFINNYIPKEIVREEISLICYDNKQYLIKYEYFTTYIKLNDGNEIDFSQSLQFAKEEEEKKEPLFTDNLYMKVNNDLMLDHSLRKGNEKEFLKKILPKLMALYQKPRKIVIETNNINNEEPTTSTVIRHALLNDNTSEINISVVVRQNNQNLVTNGLNANEYLPPYFTDKGAIKGLANILLFHKFKIERDYHDSKAFGFKINITS